MNKKIVLNGALALGIALVIVNAGAFCVRFLVGGPHRPWQLSSDYMATILSVKN